MLLQCFAMSDKDVVLEMLRTEGPQPVKALQAMTSYQSRSQFLVEVIDPLIEAGLIYRDGNIKSPKAIIKLT